MSCRNWMSGTKSPLKLYSCSVDQHHGHSTFKIRFNQGILHLLKHWRCIVTYFKDIFFITNTHSLIFCYPSPSSSELIRTVICNQGMGHYHKHNRIYRYIVMFHSTIPWGSWAWKPRTFPRRWDQSLDQWGGSQTHSPGIKKMVQISSFKKHVVILFIYLNSYKQLVTYEIHRYLESEDIRCLAEVKVM